MTPAEKKERALKKIQRYFETLLASDPEFYGSVEVNFSNGEAVMVNKKQSTRLE